MSKTLCLGKVSRTRRLKPRSGLETPYPMIIQCQESSNHENRAPVLHTLCTLGRHCRKMVKEWFNGSFPTCPLLSLEGGCVSCWKRLINDLPLVGKKSEKLISISPHWPSKEGGCNSDWCACTSSPSPCAVSSSGMASLNCHHACPLFSEDAPLNNECWDLTSVLVVVIA